MAEDRHDAAEIARNARTYAMLLLDLPGREQEALVMAQKALAIVEDGPPSANLAWAHATLARTLWRADRATEADQQARAAVADADAIAEPDEMALGAKADGLVTMSVYAQHVGEEERARQLIGEARELAHRSDHLTVELRSHFNLGMSLLDAGRLDAAVAAFAEGEARAESVGLSWSGYGIDLRVVHVIAMFLLGDWDRAEAAARIAGRMVSASVASRLTAAGMLVATARGRLAEVEAALAELAELPARDDQVAVHAGAAGIEAALWAGAPHTAAERASTRPCARCRWWTPRHMGMIAVAALGVGVQAELAAAGGSAESALAEAERLTALAADVAAHGVPRASELGPEGRAWLAWALAELTRLTGPDPEAWSAVFTAFAFAGGAPEVPGYRQAQALLRRAEARLALGEPAAAAAEDLASAHTAAARLGAAPLAAAVAATARRAGVRLAGTEPVPRSVRGRRSAHPARAVGARSRGGRAHQPAGRRGAVHQREDGERAPVPGDGEARREQPHRGRQHGVRAGVADPVRQLRAPRLRERERPAARRSISSAPLAPAGQRWALRPLEDHGPATTVG